MIDGLKPYPAYKDSGVPWLGEVPAHWEVRRLGSLLQERRETNEGLRVTEVLSVLRERGVIPYAEKGNIGNKKSDDISRYKIVRPNDIVVNSMNVVIGSVGLSKFTGCISPVYYIVTRREAQDDPRYLNAYFRTKPFQQSLIRLGNGILAHRMRIPMELLKCEPFPLPPANEQTAIVRFLDYVDRRIRRSIRAKQKLIKLLEEYRQALIHQAVTGKIDVGTGKPYPAYKDSGVPWLGQVPAHWDVVPLKRLAWFKSGAGFPVHYQGETSAEIPFFKVSDMNIPGNEKYLHVCANTVSMAVAQDLGATVLPAGTIVFPKVGGALLTNKRRIAANQCCIDNNMMGCVVRNGNRDFLFLIMSYIDLGQIAKPGPVPAISEGEVREIRVALPSAPEQTAIVEYLDAEAAKLDTAIAAARREIELLREYRERLIADVVTGKVDVRGVAAQLPDEPAEEEAGTEEEEPVAEELATADSQEEANGEE